MVNPRVPTRLLFFPGAPGNRDFCEPLSGALRFEADKVLLDYPGFAGVPPDPSITSFDRLVDVLVSRIDRPAALIAQSMGACLPSRRAICKRTLITHLVLVATSGGLDTSELGAVDWRQNFQQDHPDLPKWFTSYNSDLTSQLSGIDVPVLLLWGDCDPIRPLAIGEALLSHLPNAMLHVVPGGQHDLARVHAQSIAPLIDAHVQSKRAS